MAMEIITKEDLEAFGDKLISQMRALLSSNGGLESGEPLKFLKSYQVRNLLKISPNTLQCLRKNGTLPFSRVGGIIYYKYEDVINVLKGQTVQKKNVFNGR